ncbi:hypothetical protein RO333_000473 [Pseudomonas aeruginosa]|nr:hypothetical protein [Pseudomonas aeruginosa]
MARNRAQQLCIVTLDYQRFLLPQADALKLIDIMSRAAEVQAAYASGAGFKYTVGEVPEVELTIVRPSQLVMPQAEPAPATPRARRKSPAQVTHDAIRLLEGL